MHSPRINNPSVLKRHEKTFAQKPYGRTLSENPIFEVDEKTYVDPQNCPDNLQVLEKKLYDSKVAKFKSLDAKTVFINIGSKSGYFEVVENREIRFSHPSNYPYCTFPRGGKDTFVARINQSYRFAGHIYWGNCTFYLFWVDLSPHQIYKDKKD